MRSTTPRAAGRLVCATALLLASGVLAACGDSPPAVRAPVDPAAIEAAPWERDWDPDELGFVLEGKLFEPEAPAAPGTEPSFRPCVGATVTASIPRPRGLPPHVPGPSAVTDAEGRFRIAGVPRDCFLLHASMDGRPRAFGGWGLAPVGMVLIEPRPDFPFGLQLGRPAIVTVKDPAGKPVPGVLLRTESLAWSETIRTGADGRAEFTAVDADFSVQTWHGGRDVVRADLKTDSFAPGAPMTATLVAPAAPALAGRVLRAEDGAPVVGAVVTWSEDPRSRTVTGDDGRFLLDVPRDGRVSAFADGLAWTSAEVTRVVDMEIRLPAADVVSGRVLLADGAPAAAVRVRAVGVGPDGRPLAVDGPLTAADGTFRFSWTPRQPRGVAGPVRIVATHRRLGASEPVALPAPGPVELRLSGRRSVAGRFTDHSGAGIAGARVAARWTYGDLDDGAAASFGLETSRDGTTAADGSFVLPDVPAGIPVDVRAERLGVAVRTSVAPGASEVPALVLPKGGSVRGIVRDAAGAATPGASVAIELLDTPGIEIQRFGEAGPDGRFVFEDLPDGRYHLRAEADGYSIPGTAETRPGAGDVTISVGRRGRIRLTLRGPADAGPLPELTAYFDDLEASALPSRPNVCVPRADGTFTAESGEVRPGRWGIRVIGGPWRAFADEVVVADGEDRQVSLPLERTAVFRGVLADSAGRPVPAAVMYFLPAPGSDAAAKVLTVRSGPAGEFEVTGLRPGAWTMRCTPRDLPSLESGFDVPAAAWSDEREVRLPPGGDLVVRVTGRGVDAGSTIVSFATPGGDSLVGWTPGVEALVPRVRLAADGRATIRGLPVGPVRVSVSVSGRRAPLTAEAVVSEGRTTELDVSAD